MWFTRLPKRFDRKDEMGEILNQGRYNRCAAYACASIIEWKHKIWNINTIVDPIALYNKMKDIDGTDSEGSFPLTAIKAAFHYNKQYRVRYYKTLPLNIEKIKKEIHNKDCGVIGAVMLYDNYKESKNSGILTCESFKRKGWHTMHWIGWDDDREAFIAKNSWGREWGDEGYLWVPYKYFKNDIQMFYSIYFK